MFQFTWTENTGKRFYWNLPVGLKHDGTDGQDGTAYTDGTAGLVADGTDYEDVSAQ